MKTAGTCLALAGLQLLVWVRERTLWAYFWFSLSALGASATAIFELALMHAESADETGFWIRWMHASVTVCVVALIWFNLAPSAKSNFDKGPVLGIVTLVLLLGILAFFRGMISRLALPRPRNNALRTTVRAMKSAACVNRKRDATSPATKHARSHARTRRGGA